MGFLKNLWNGVKKVGKGFLKGIDTIYGTPARWVRDNVITPGLDKISKTGKLGKMIADGARIIQDMDPFYNGFFNEKKKPQQQPTPQEQQPPDKPQDKM